MRPLPAIPFACIITMLGTTILLSALTARRVPEVLTVPLDSLGTEISGWHASGDHSLAAGTQRVLDATSYLSRSYRKDARSLDLFVAYYAQQRAGESMHSPKHCLPGAGWEIWNHDLVTIPLDNNGVEVNKYSIQNNGIRMLMLYWYQSKDRI